MPDMALERINALLQECLIGTRIEVVDVVFRREGSQFMLRVFVDKEGGITIDECARINRDLSQLLEEQNVIEERYTLEVSSPGMDRPLKIEKDFVKARGKTVKIVTQKPINNNNVFVGNIDDVCAGRVVITAAGGETREIPLALILRANLYIA